MKTEINDCLKNKQHFRLRFLMAIWLISVIKVSSVSETESDLI